MHNGESFAFIHLDLELTKQSFDWFLFYSMDFTSYSEKKKKKIENFVVKWEISAWNILEKNIRETHM